ncbi:MAG: hypothetical protein DCC43_09155 [Candidatus Brocadia sp.]|jgi:hypothetical protein|nr:MAG: hypothetical protein B6D35_03585 [Candidatus Brocadia sp. UTAMX2]RIJ98920.1 MAG: hypothetical protein DCC43_09155 [Candidatus Brocadia sp.]
MMKIITVYLFILQAVIISYLYTDAFASDSIQGGDSGAETTTDKPKIVFEEQIYNFGKIFIGEIVEYGFKFKNEGQGELIVSNVKSSCGCTAALVSKSHLRKGETGEVKVKFNPGRYVGKVSKTVMVNSNDPKDSSLKLTIAGEVIEEVSVNPKRINFGIIRKGDSCTRNIEVKTIPELKIEVKKVESPNPYVSIKEEKGDDHSTHRFQITIDKYDYVGKFNGIIFVYTSSGKQERVDVPFSGEIVGDITFYPEMVSFGKVTKDRNTDRTVIINFVNKAVKIEKIEVDPKVINYTVTEITPTSKKIQVTVEKNSFIGEIAGSLTIYTNSAIQPVIHIPLNGEIKG